MGSLDENSCLKYIRYFEYSSFNFQDFVSGQIENSVAIFHSSCKSLISNFGSQCIHFMDEKNCEVDNFEDYNWPNDSYMSNFFESNQLLILLVNILMLIIFIFAPNLLLSINEFFIYLLNQVRLIHILHLDWFQVFSILAFFLMIMMLVLIVVYQGGWFDTFNMWERWLFHSITFKICSKWFIFVVSPSRTLCLNHPIGSRFLF